MRLQVADGLRAQCVCCGSVMDDWVCLAHWKDVRKLQTVEVWLRVYKYIDRLLDRHTRHLILSSAVDYFISPATLHTPVRRLYSRLYAALFIALLQPSVMIFGVDGYQMASSLSHICCQHMTAVTCHQVAWCKQCARVQLFAFSIHHEFLWTSCSRSYPPQNSLR